MYNDNIASLFPGIFKLYNNDIKAKDLINTIYSIRVTE